MNTTTTRKATETVNLALALALLLRVASILIHVGLVRPLLAAQYGLARWQNALMDNGIESTVIRWFVRPPAPATRQPAREAR